MIPAAEWNAAKRKQTAADYARLARWLRVPDDHEWLKFAIMPFVVMQTDDGAAPCAAIIPPIVYFDMSPAVDDWPLDRIGGCHIESDIVRCDTGALYRVGGDAIIMPTQTEGEMNVYTEAKSWARAWARKRLQWMAHRAMVAKELGTDAVEPLDGCLPGALIVGNPNKIRHWPRGVTFKAPDPDTAKIINISIWRDARLARAK
jgi:hypothetical protein